MTKARIILTNLILIFIICGLTTFAYPKEKAPTFNLKFQSFLPPEQTKEDCQRFADKVYAMTNGEIKITVFPANALVPVKEILTAVKTGAVRDGAGVERLSSGAHDLEDLVGVAHCAAPSVEVSSGTTMPFSRT